MVTLEHVGMVKQSFDGVGMNPGSQAAPPQETRTLPSIGAPAPLSYNSADVPPS